MGGAGGDEIEGLYRGGRGDALALAIHAAFEGLDRHGAVSEGEREVLGRDEDVVEHDVALRRRAHDDPAGAEDFLHALVRAGNNL